TVGRIELEVLAHASTVGIAGLAGVAADPVGANGRGVGRRCRARRATGPTVLQVRVQVGLAAVAGVVVAVREARVAGGEGADAVAAAGRPVGSGADGATGPAVVGVAEQAGFAAAAGVAVTVAEAAVTGEPAGRAAASRGRVRGRRADAAAGPAVACIG